MDRRQNIRRHSSLATDRSDTIVVFSFSLRPNEQKMNPYRHCHVCQMDLRSYSPISDFVWRCANCKKDFCEDCMLDMSGSAFGYSDWECDDCVPYVPRNKDGMEEAYRRCWNEGCECKAKKNDYYCEKCSTKCFTKGCEGQAKQNEAYCNKCLTKCLTKGCAGIREKNEAYCEKCLVFVPVCPPC